jgi:hypothetical protein
MYEAIPTLAPGIKWKENPQAGIGIFDAVFDIENFKTAKTIQHKIIVPATEKFPAQIEKWEEQIPVGKYSISTQCSMLTPARKSVLIGKIDKLIQGCKQARQRANCVEVEDAQIGKILFNYINS